MALTIYHYPKCGTCRKAIKWLEERGKTLEKIDIALNPPSAEQLCQWKEASGLDLKKFERKERSNVRRRTAGFAGVKRHVD